MAPNTQANYFTPDWPRLQILMCLCGMTESSPTWVCLDLESVGAAASDRPQIPAIFTQALRRNDQTPETHHLLFPLAFSPAPITHSDNVV